MRKFSGIVSILFLLFGVSTIYLALSFNLVLAHLYQILLVSYLLSWIFALYSKKSIWKTLSIIALVLVSFVIIGFFLIMTLLWNKP